MSKTQLIISLPNLFVFQGFSTQHLHLFRRESLKFKNHPWPLTLLHLYIKSVTKVNSCNPLNVSQIPTPHCVTFHLNTRIATSMASCFHSEYTLLSALHRNVFQIKSDYLPLLRNLKRFLCLSGLRSLAYMAPACPDLHYLLMPLLLLQRLSHIAYISVPHCSFLPQSLSTHCSLCPIPPLPLEQCFSSFNVQVNYLWVLLK